MKNYVFLFLFLLQNSVFAQLVDIHIVDDYLNQNFDNGYNWERFQLIENKQVILNKDYTSFICSVVEGDTICLSKGNLITYENKNNNFQKCLIFTNFKGSCERGLSFSLENLNPSQNYLLRFFTNWGDSIEFAFNSSKNSVLIDLRNYYNDDLFYLDENEEIIKYIDQGNTLMIRKEIYGCYDGEMQTCQVYKKDSSYFANIDEKQFILSKSLLNKILKLRQDIEDLESSPHTNRNINTTYMYYFKIGNYLISKRDNTGGKWKIFDNLLTEIER